ncbi:MAG: hypothetical protein V4645_18165 [Pseudomonadota bacterium]
MTQTDLLTVCAVAGAVGYYFWKIKPAAAAATPTPTPSQDSASLQASLAQLQSELDAAKKVVPGAT